MRTKLKQNSEPSKAGSQQVKQTALWLSVNSLLRKRSADSLSLTMKDLFIAFNGSSQSNDPEDRSCVTMFYFSFQKFLGEVTKETDVTSLISAVSAFETMHSMIDVESWIEGMFRCYVTSHWIEYTSDDERKSMLADVDSLKEFFQSISAAESMDATQLNEALEIERTELTRTLAHLQEEKTSLIDAIKNRKEAGHE